ncbi:hypothetical protein GJ744_005183 [Endocarpon pusillum]|uniref:Uncharacterized protein n=1 Tax=Endocarpon pusillum TaxID=364733 RepID=A0A8H7E197_9EURO|nr:hypothetical protein GJ744_005183 [Endocarpon pusillum]
MYEIFSLGLLPLFDIIFTPQTLPEQNRLCQTVMTFFSPEVIIALSLGLPTLSFAILTWWESRRRQYRARYMEDLSLFELLLLSHLTLQTRPTTAPSTILPMNQRHTFQEATVNHIEPIYTRYNNTRNTIQNQSRSPA